MQADCIFLDMHPPLNHLIKYFSICCRLFQVRGKLYELLVNCIPPEIILKVKTTFFHVVIVNFFFFFFSFWNEDWVYLQTGLEENSSNTLRGDS